VSVGTWVEAIAMESLNPHEPWPQLPGRTDSGALK